LKVPLSKSGVPATVPRVRIPPSPPHYAIVKSMEATLFTKIINKEIPAHIVYEDDKTLAFLDIFPIVRGHTLVIPKKQVENIWDLADEDYQAVMATVKKVALRLDRVLSPSKVGLKVMGTDVPHAHVHVIPFNTPEEFHVTANHNETDHSELERLAKELYIN
jgi:histidine triad (HIT) family protein